MSTSSSTRATPKPNLRISSNNLGPQKLIKHHSNLKAANRYNKNFTGLHAKSLTIPQTNITSQEKPKPAQLEISEKPLATDENSSSILELNIEDTLDQNLLKNHHSNLIEYERQSTNKNHQVNPGKCTNNIIIDTCLDKWVYTPISKNIKDNWINNASVTRERFEKYKKQKSPSPKITNKIVIAKDGYDKIKNICAAVLEKDEKEMEAERLLNDKEAKNLKVIDDSFEHERKSQNMRKSFATQRKDWASVFKASADLIASCNKNRREVDQFMVSDGLKSQKDNGQLRSIMMEKIEHYKSALQKQDTKKMLKQSKDMAGQLNSIKNQSPSQQLMYSQTSSLNQDRSQIKFGRQNSLSKDRLSHIPRPYDTPKKTKQYPLGDATNSCFRSAKSSFKDTSKVYLPKHALDDPKFHDKIVDKAIQENSRLDPRNSHSSVTSIKRYVGRDEFDYEIIPNLAQTDTINKIKKKLINCKKDSGSVFSNPSKYRETSLDSNSSFGYDNRNIPYFSSPVVNEKTKQGYILISKDPKKTKICCTTVDLLGHELEKRVKGCYKKKQDDIEQQEVKLKKVFDKKRDELLNFNQNELYRRDKPHDYDGKIDPFLARQDTKDLEEDAQSIFDNADNIKLQKDLRYKKVKRYKDKPLKNYQMPVMMSRLCRESGEGVFAEFFDINKKHEYFKLPLDDNFEGYNRQDLIKLYEKIKLQKQQSYSSLGRVKDNIRESKNYRDSIRVKKSSLHIVSKTESLETWNKNPDKNLKKSTENSFEYSFDEDKSNSDINHKEQKDKDCFDYIEENPNIDNKFEVTNTINEESQPLYGLQRSQYSIRDSKFSSNIGQNILLKEKLENKTVSSVAECRLSNIVVESTLPKLKEKPIYIEARQKAIEATQRLVGELKRRTPTGSKTVQDFEDDCNGKVEYLTEPYSNFLFIKNRNGST